MRSRFRGTESMLAETVLAENARTGCRGMLVQAHVLRNTAQRNMAGRRLKRVA